MKPRQQEQIRYSLVTRWSLDDPKKKQEMADLSMLKPGVNKGLLFSLKITNLASAADKVPANFIFIDKLGNFGMLSVYNNNEKLAEEMKNLV
jgi:hypothetical protein